MQTFVVRGGNRSAESSQLLSGALLWPPCLPWLCRTELSLQLLPLISLEAWPVAMVVADGPDRGQLLLDSEAWEGLADGNLLYPVGVPEDGGCPGEVIASAMPSQGHGPLCFPGLVAPTPPSPLDGARIGGCVPSRDVDTDWGCTLCWATLSLWGPVSKGVGRGWRSHPFIHGSVGGVGVGWGRRTLGGEGQSSLRLCQGPGRGNPVWKRGAQGESRT